MVGRGHKGILIIEYQGKIVKWDFMVNKYSFIFNLKAKKKKKKGEEQDGRGVAGHGIHPSPGTHQEYPFRHRIACRTSST